MEIDLNINNYNLEDILDLFSLPLNFNEGHLKLAKKIVLKTHPDKSKLDNEYFLFFCKAYKVLYQIYEFRNKKTTETTYVIDKNEEDNEKKIILDRFKSKNTKEFNTWFNELFEKTKIQDDNANNGYGDWLKSSEDMENITLAKHEMNDYFINKKRDARELICKTEIEPIYSGGGHNLIGESPNGYSSDIFSNLQYDDLKQVHKQSVIPVTDDDLKNIKQFDSVENIRNFRNKQNITPLSLEESNTYLNKNKTHEDAANIRLAYQLAKQDEKIKKANDEWWGNLRQLSNG